MNALKERDYSRPLGLEMEGFEEPEREWYPLDAKAAVKVLSTNTHPCDPAMIKKPKAKKPSLDEVNRQLSIEDARAETLLRAETMSRLKRLCNFGEENPSDLERTARELFLRGEISRFETIIHPDDDQIWNIQLPVRIYELRHEHGFKDVIKTVGVKLPSGKRAVKYVLTYWGRVEEVEGKGRE